MALEKNKIHSHLDALCGRQRALLAQRENETVLDGSLTGIQIYDTVTPSVDGDTSC